MTYLIKAYSYISISFLFSIPVLAGPNSISNQCKDFSQDYFIRGKWDSKDVGARLWDLQKLNTEFKQPSTSTNDCLQETWKQAITDQKEYWVFISNKWGCNPAGQASNLITCTEERSKKVEGELNYIKSINQAASLNGANYNCEEHKLPTGLKPQLKSFSDIAARIWTDFKNSAKNFKPIVVPPEALAALNEQITDECGHIPADRRAKPKKPVDMAELNKKIESTDPNVELTNDELLEIGRQLGLATAIDFVSVTSSIGATSPICTEAAIKSEAAWSKNTGQAARNTTNDVIDALATPEGREQIHLSVVNTASRIVKFVMNPVDETETYANEVLFPAVDAIKAEVQTQFGDWHCLRDDVKAELACTVAANLSLTTLTMMGGGAAVKAGSTALSGARLTAAKSEIVNAIVNAREKLNLGKRLTTVAKVGITGLLVAGTVSTNVVRTAVATATSGVYAAIDKGKVLIGAKGRWFEVKDPKTARVLRQQVEDVQKIQADSLDRIQNASRGVDVTKELPPIAVPATKYRNYSAMINDLEKQDKLYVSDYWASGNMNTPVPMQGYKLHVSPNPENLLRVTEELIPYLNKRKVSFKFISSEDKYEALNLDSQAGKAVTIYPRSSKEAQEIAEDIKKLLQSKGFKPDDFMEVDGEQRVGGSFGIFTRYGQVAGYGDTRSVIYKTNVNNQILDRDNNVLVIQGRPVLATVPLELQFLGRDPVSIAEQIRNRGYAVYDRRNQIKPEWAPEFN